MKLSHIGAAALFTLCISLLSASAAIAKPRIHVTQSKNLGFYKANETITWTISTSGIETSRTSQATYTLERGGLDMVQKGKLDLSQGSKQIKASLDKPGSFLLTVYVPSSHPRRPTRQRSGAIIEAKQLKPSLPKPKDFESFWKDKLKAQDKVPMNPQLTKEKTTRKGIDSWQLTMDTIKSQHIRGRLAVKDDGKKYPALLRVQWAGVYGLEPNWALSEANRGWLTLNLFPHDEAFDKDKAYYAALKKGKLGNYTGIGSDNRETSYFLRMALACSRAVDYLSQHPRWNGKTIVVSGTSQGGYQAFIAAALNKKVTAIQALVPAGSDHTAPLANRAFGWPNWLRNDESNKQKIEASRYYDMINFASMVECPALVGIGLGDVSVRAEGVICAINNMQGPVEVVAMPQADHNGNFDEYKKRTAAWTTALRKDNIPKLQTHPILKQN